MRQQNRGEIMAFDGIVTNAVARELKDTLLLGKIEKIYQPESDELVFHIHTKKGNYRLYASSGSDHARIHLIQKIHLILRCLWLSACS